MLSSEDFDQRLKGTRTLVNLARSFAGESQAAQRYVMMANRAHMDGLEELSTLLKGLAVNEQAHATVWYDLITDKKTEYHINIDIDAGYPFNGGSLLDMIAQAVHNETEEGKEIYPSFAATAEQEGFPLISNKYKLVAAVENCHAELLTKLEAMLRDGSLYRKDVHMKFKCGHCGHEATGYQPWKICPICGYKQGHVMIELN